MKIVTIHEAKTHLSRLLKEVEAGEEIVIARGKIEIARLAPLGAQAQPVRKPGELSHIGWSDAADEALEAEAFTEDDLERMEALFPVPEPVR